MADDKVRENYLRRMAKRQGLELQKSKARKWSIDNHQGYRIIDPTVNRIEAGEKYNLTLDEVERYLTKNEKK